MKNYTTKALARLTHIIVNLIVVSLSAIFTLAEIVTIAIPYVLLDFYPFSVASRVINILYEFRDEIVNE